jgi:hypothetical protein
MILIQFFIFIIIIIIIGNNIKKERFDISLDKITNAECGRICTKSSTCKGYSYNQETKECYLSKTQILGPPNYGKYIKNYKASLPRCNKLRALSDKRAVIQDDPETNLKYNSIYLCSPTEDANYEYYRIVNGKVDKLEDIDPVTIDNLDPINYLVEEIDWASPDKEGIKDNMLISLEEEAEELRPYYLYTKEPEEYLGQYMYPHKCVSNISLKDCLETCDAYKSCKGAEWNPTYKKDKNICCPKINIVKKINRRNEFETGNFYLKKYTDKLDKKNTYVKL